MFEQPIVIFSEYCQYSKKFLDLLQTHKELGQAFQYLNIDVIPETKTRPREFYEIQKILKFQIKEIPTIVVENASYILTGKEAFKWLDFNIKKLKQLNVSKDPSAFNMMEMNSFSDSYAPYNENQQTNLNDATEQNYRKLSDIQDEIYELPPEDDESRDIKSMEQERQMFDKMIEEKRYPNGADIPKPQIISRGGINSGATSYDPSTSERCSTFARRGDTIDFTNPNFGLAGKMGKMDQRNSKEREMQERLEQMEQERNKVIGTQAKHNVDFRTGKIF